jgi:hypothetical protein
MEPGVRCGKRSVPTGVKDPFFQWNRWGFASWSSFCPQCVHKVCVYGLLDENGLTENRGKVN